MPRITVHGGPSYAGHVDTSPSDVAEPEWRVVVPAYSEEIVVREAPEPQPLASRRRTRRTSA